MSLSRRTMPAERVLAIVEEAARGLQAIFEDIGEPHLDVTPNNLLLTSSGTVLVTDFGLAPTLNTQPGHLDELLETAGIEPSPHLRASFRDHDEAAADLERQRRRTSRGGNGSSHPVVFGTPFYMAPEMACGLTVDHRADMYALGIIAYQLLTGSVPFFASSTGQILQQHLRLRPEWTERSRSDVPPAVVAFVDRLLAKRVVDRFQTYDEMLAALDASRAGRLPDRASAVPAAFVAPAGAASPSADAPSAEYSEFKYMTGMEPVATDDPVEDTEDDPPPHADIEYYVMRYDLQPMAVMQGPWAGGHRLVFLAGCEATIGQGSNFEIDLSEPGGQVPPRTFGRIFRSTEGWRIERSAVVGPSAVPLCVNARLLADGEAIPLADGDILLFDNRICCTVRRPLVQGTGDGLELARDDDGEGGFVPGGRTEACRWIFVADRVLVGGSPDCHVHLPGLDAPLCSLVFQQDIFWLAPLQNGASAGVDVGYEPLTSWQALFHDDVIHLGGVEYRFRQVSRVADLASPFGPPAAGTKGGPTRG